MNFKEAYEYGKNIDLYMKIPNSFKSLEDRIYNEVCLKALAIQIPKVIEIEDWNTTYCPNPDCNTELSTSEGDGYYKHPTFLEMCPHCGQKIYWRE